MIKAKKGNQIILGLSDENMKRLSQDQPIKFNLSEIVTGLDMEVFIFNGRDEQTMFEMMKGSIHPTKTVFKSSREKEN